MPDQYRSGRLWSVASSACVRRSAASSARASGVSAGRVDARARRRNGLAVFCAVAGVEGTAQRWRCSSGLVRIAESRGAMGAGASGAKAEICSSVQYAASFLAGVGAVVNCSRRSVVRAGRPLCRRARSRSSQRAMRTSHSLSLGWRATSWASVSFVRSVSWGRVGSP